MPRLRAPRRASPKVVIFSQATNQILFELGEHLSKELGDVILHTGTSFNARSSQYQIWPAPLYSNASLKSRAKTWAKYLAHSVLSSSQMSGKPTLLITTNPPMLPVIAWFLKKTRGWPYAIWVWDVYPDVLHRQGLIDPSHKLYRVWAALNRLAFEEADHVITLGPVMANTLSQYCDREIEVIPCWVDTDVIKPLPKSDNAFAVKHNLQHKRVFLYSGNLGLTHDISGIIEGAIAKTKNTSAQFLFIGGGGRAEELQAVANKHEHVLWLPYQPWEVVPQSMASADVGVVTLGQGTEGISMPSKCYYLMAAGNALLGLSSGDNDLARTINTYECGINVDPNDHNAVIEAVRRFQTDEDFLRRCQRNARAAAVEHFSTKVVQTKFGELIASMVGAF